MFGYCCDAHKQRAESRMFALLDPTAQRHVNDALAERSKAVAQGAIPKGRGFEPHRRHFFVHACPASARSRRGGWRKHSLHDCFLNSVG